ncbi:MAG TPA: diphosphomevalonate decarboxylase [Bdellovibrionota bacterium]|nr:diphosphomevalonate decarboxylase [Bdellovibrionota bacterium]
MPCDWEVKKVTSEKVARVFVPTNIALVKYWGKRDTKLNLPTHSSLSATLDKFGTYTTVEFLEDLIEDEFILNGKYIESPKGEVVLEHLRSLAKSGLHARIQSQNNIPTGAGLASSASGLAALTLAAARALNLDLSKEKLSQISRLGSGSSCRSFWGGFVEWQAGVNPDGSDCRASQFVDESHWKLKIFVLILDETKKEISSTVGMERSRLTSPFFGEWIKKAQADCEHTKNIIEKRDFKLLAQIVESNCLFMHKTALSAQPPVIYWNQKTLEVLDRVRDWQREGINVFFTIDAGANVILFAEPKDQENLKSRFSKIEPISVLETEIGPGPFYLN